MKHKIMKKIKFTDEQTFVTEIVDFTDEHYKIAKELYRQFGNYGSIIVREDKKSLSFAINKGTDRVSREVGSNLYRVIIEKVEKK